VKKYEKQGKVGLNIIQTTSTKSSRSHRTKTAY
jgi:hypothetical protein